MGCEVGEVLWGVRCPWGDVSHTYVMSCRGFDNFDVRQAPWCHTHPIPSGERGAWCDLPHPLPQEPCQTSACIKTYTQCPVP